jgi:hypothetical protein
MGVSVNLDTGKLDTILRRMDAEATDALNDAGTDLAAMVRSEVTAMGVVDTGRLRDSVEWRGNWHAGRPFMRVAVEKFKRYFRENYFGRLFD